jgi:hypothetical protein
MGPSQAALWGSPYEPAADLFITRINIRVQCFKQLEVLLFAAPGRFAWFFTESE